MRDPRWLGFRDAARLSLTIGKDFGLTPSSAAGLKPARADDETVSRLLS